MHSCTRKHVIYGNRDGVEVRALASRQCDSGSIPCPCYMWAEFALASRLAPRVFLWVPHSTKKKKKFSKFEFYQDSVPGWKLAKTDETSSLNILVLYVEKGKLLSLTQKGKLSLNSISSHISFLILQLFICFSIDVMLSWIQAHRICIFVLTGNYVYTEATPQSPGDNAKLQLVVPRRNSTSCLTFFYHMYGYSMGTLNVFSGNTTIFTVSGDQGDYWRKVSRTVNSSDVVIMPVLLNKLVHTLIFPSVWKTAIYILSKHWNLL